MDLKGTYNNNSNNNNVSDDGYMLLEATGDSESDCINNPNNMVEQQHAYEYGIYNMAADVDDAQSCSCDDEFENPAENNKLKGCLNAASSADDDRDGKKKKGDFCGNSCCDEDVGMMQEHYKSCVSDDSCLEPVDEVEKSRQFWEACLAS
ncbi:hypothetical protein PIB30_003455 [Stylosanthes scabra]|uniref:Uncharacterized protein n=1 Tax=Stylosanthes scabra TaxID=79078 RepID=A0ABU6U285_9FABA|nr:hypothetical protein [Stylosanthes scabra]